MLSDLNISEVLMEISRIYDDSDRFKIIYATEAFVSWNSNVVYEIYHPMFITDTQIK